MNSKKTKADGTIDTGTDQKNELGLRQQTAEPQTIKMGDKEKRGRRPKGLSTFSKNFAKLLLEKKCSHRRAAKIAGIAPSVISGWTAGSTPNDPGALLKITDALEADFQFILTGVPSTAISAHRIAELFHVEDHEGLTGMFVLEAKRLRVRK